MQSPFILFAISFIVACWILVLGHQLELGSLNLARYPNFSGSLVIAYTVAGLSACVAVVAAIMAFKR